MNYWCNLSALEMEMTAAKLNGFDQIPAELIEAGNRTVHSEIQERSINLVILFEIMNNDWSHLLHLSIRRVIKLAVVIVKAYHCYYLHTKLCQNSSRNCWGLSAWAEYNISVTVYAAFVC